MDPHVTHNSGNDEWYTLSFILDAARRTMGAFDCDPASSDFANTLVRAKTYYTIETNGLMQPWGRRVWMNPPYSRKLVNRFMEALRDRVQIGQVEEACVISNNATETAWARTILRIASSICFLKSRVAFLDSTGQVKHKPLQGQMVVFIGDHKEAFHREFFSLGTVVDVIRDPNTFDPRLSRIAATFQMEECQ